jgi:hypothetical protein
MKALSLWQPWASLIAIGVKPEETRSWPAPKWLVGQRFAIHAAKKPLQQTLAEAGVSQAVMVRMVEALHAAGVKPLNLPFGKVVCTAVLKPSVRVARFFPGDFNGGSLRHPHAITECGKRIEANVFGDFSPGRWIWPLIDVEQVEPFDAVGRQGIFELDGPAASRTAPLFGGAS